VVNHTSHFYHDTIHPSTGFSAVLEMEIHHIYPFITLGGTAPAWRKKREPTGYFLFLRILSKELGYGKSKSHYITFHKNVYR
jgi:hypothetical protein